MPFPRTMQMQTRLLILNSRVLWVSSANISAETGEEKRSDLGNKHELLFDDLNNQRKHEGGVHHSGLHDKNPHISMTTEDGSATGNKDVAKSPWPRFPGFYFNVNKPTSSN